MNPSEVFASIRDLAVQLHRGNAEQAESLIQELGAYLNTVMVANDNAEEAVLERAQQTMFAIDEARTLLSQRNFFGAASAARDAAREWRPSATRN